MPQRRKILTTVLLAVALSAALPVRADESTDAARAVMERFMAAFNARDIEAWADTLVYPHVRLASGDVTVYADRAAFVAASPFAALTANEGWHHSAWQGIRVVQASAEKVHFAVEFARFHENGERYATYPSLYVVERVAGRWGVRARSSFAP